MVLHFEWLVTVMWKRMWGVPCKKMTSLLFLTKGDLGKSLFYND